MSPNVEGLTVDEIVDLLAQSGRDKYEFIAEGIGCRGWTTDNLALLTGRKWLIGNKEVLSATADVLKLWPDGAPLAIDDGVYYD
jgi:hypothetical protein